MKFIALLFLISGTMIYSMDHGFLPSTIEACAHADENKKKIRLISNQQSAISNQQSAISNQKKKPIVVAGIQTKKNEDKK